MGTNDENAVINTGAAKDCAYILRKCAEGAGNMYMQDTYDPNKMKYDYTVSLDDEVRNVMHKLHLELPDLFRLAAEYIMYLVEEVSNNGEKRLNPSIEALKQLEAECPALYLRVAGITPNAKGLRITFYNKNTGEEDPEICLNTYKEENNDE